MFGHAETIGKITFYPDAGEVTVAHEFALCVVERTSRIIAENRRRFFELRSWGADSPA
ncbi:hypothetical protein AfiDRAFT_1738 [Afipia sp. 1NLS2]|nr:hypothetical protein AfiDRAFT_1738 [Afipia sp. 1NLS2]